MRRFLWVGLVLLMASPGFPTDVSDDFNRADSDSMGSDWSEDNGDTDISSNQAIATTGSWARVAIIWTADTIDDDQYVKATLTRMDGSDYPFIILRYTDSSSEMYRLQVSGANTYWSRCATLTGSCGSDIETSTAVTWSATDEVAVTIEGTGDDTVIRVWENPTNDTPAQVDGWDNGSDTADITFTTNPSDPVDTGSYVGLARNDGDASGGWDDFFAGDFAAAPAATPQLTLMGVGP